MAESQTKTVKSFLIVRADGTMRVVKTKPYQGSLRLDEVAFPLNVTIPITWGRVQAISIDLEMPEPPDAVVSVGEPQTAEVE